MSDVKWIKLAVQMFNVSRKIKNIEKLKGGDTILVIWFKLLCLAGEINDGGAIYIADGVAYTDGELADELRRPLKTVQRALSIFTEYGMIRRDDSGVIYLVSWAKYQNVDGLDRIREQTRKRVSECRERKKQSEKEDVFGNAVDRYNVTQCNVTSNVTCNATVTQCNATDKERRNKKEDIDTAVAVVTRTGARKKATTAAKDESSRLKLIGGTIGKGVVYLSDGQIEKLLETMGSVEVFNRYVGRLADYIIEKNAHINSHYNTILKWYTEDSTT